MQHKQASLEVCIPHTSNEVPIQKLLLHLKFLPYISSSVLFFCKEKWFFWEIRVKASVQVSWER